MLLCVWWWWWGGTGWFFLFFFSLHFYTGAPHNCLAVSEIVGRACREAEVYRRCGVHGVIVENMHDVPYLRDGVGSEVVASMTRIASDVREVIGKDMLLGIQVLSCMLFEGVW